MARLVGKKIRVLYRSGLRDTAGNEAHAATFIRARLIVLDRELKRDPADHERVLLHEKFHFVWVRLGNPTRLAWEELLRSERGRGEAGWSAEWRKLALNASDVSGRTRRWREYCCESFCDTGALFAGAKSSENTLSRRALAGRLRWFRATFVTDIIELK